MVMKVMVCANAPDVNIVIPAKAGEVPFRVNPGEINMKVFAIKASGYLSGGMAIVAADTLKDAQIILEQALSINLCNVKYNEPDDVEILPVIYNGPACLLVYFEHGE